MKRWCALLLVFGIGIGAGSASQALAQASSIPSAAPTQNSGMSQEELGKKLMDEMLDALGGPAWLDRKYMQVSGRTAAFFRGQPNGIVVEFNGWRRFPASGHPAGERIGFLTDKSMFFPGKKVDVIQIYHDSTADEVTYKGSKTLPKEIIEDYNRRQKHSIENVVTEWLKAPGVMVIAEGQTMVERKIAEKVTVLSANNDAVTIELDATSHLPLRRTFKWRNEQFKDFDEDTETYDDYHLVDGLPTSYTLTRYRNGDMINQRFYTKVIYNQEIPNDMFDPTHLPPPQKEKEEKKKKWQH